MINDLNFLKLSPKTPILKTWGGKCFGCSPENNHGLKLSFIHVPGYCYAFYTISSDYCGFETMAHGGIVATLLDETAGWTITTNLLKFAFTMEASIKYLKPVPINTSLIIVGKLESEQGQNIFIKSSIFLENGLLLAEMNSKWFAPNQEQAMKITGRQAIELEKHSNEAFTEIRKALNKN